MIDRPPTWVGTGFMYLRPIRLAGRRVMPIGWRFAHGDSRKARVQPLRRRSVMRSFGLQHIEPREGTMNGWDRKFIEMAVLVSSWSKDPSTKVGCVIADSDHAQLRSEE